MLGTLNSLFSKVVLLSFRQWIWTLLGFVLLWVLVISIGYKFDLYDPIPIVWVFFITLLCFPIAAVLAIGKWLVINFISLRDRYGSAQAVFMLLIFVLAVSGYIVVTVWISLALTEAGLMPSGSHLKVITVISASTLAYFPILVIIHLLSRRFVR